MPRLRTSFWVLVAATFLSFGCAQRAAPEIQAPPPIPKDSRSQISPKPKKRDLQPELIAPPPAYGNKVVMAQAKPVRSTF